MPPLYLSTAHRAIPILLQLLIWSLRSIGDVHSSSKDGSEDEAHLNNLERLIQVTWSILQQTDATTTTTKETAIDDRSESVPLDGTAGSPSYLGARG